MWGVIVLQRWQGVSLVGACEIDTKINTPKSRAVFARHEPTNQHMELTPKKPTWSNNTTPKTDSTGVYSYEVSHVEIIVATCQTKAECRANCLQEYLKGQLV